jgi:hypothetical protein
MVKLTSIFFIILYVGTVYAALTKRTIVKVNGVNDLDTQYQWTYKLFQQSGTMHWILMAVPYLNGAEVPYDQAKGTGFSYRMELIAPERITIPGLGIPITGKIDTLMRAVVYSVPPDQGYNPVPNREFSSVGKTSPNDMIGSFSDLSSSDKFKKGAFYFLGGKNTFGGNNCQDFGAALYDSFIGA